jgi:hypothetical protein
MRIALGLLMALRFSVWPGCSCSCTRPARRPKGVTSGRLPDSVRCHIRVANCARIMPDHRALGDHLFLARQREPPWRRSNSERSQFHRTEFAFTDLT